MTANKTLEDLKSEVFNALGVFELEESSRTPNGTVFWLNIKKAVDRYVETNYLPREAVARAIPEKYPVYNPPKNKVQVELNKEAKIYNQAMDEIRKALKLDDKEGRNG